MVDQLPSGDPRAAFDFDAAPVFADGRALIVAKTDSGLRSWFIVKLYFHILATILLLSVLEVVWFGVLGVGERLLGLMALGVFSWLLVFVVMATVSFMGRRWVPRIARVRAQYLAWFAFCIVQSLVLAPPIAYGIAFSMTKEANTTLLPRGIVITLVMFGLLAGIAITRGRKYSLVRVLSMFTGLTAGAILLFSVAFGFSQGLIITYAVLLIACGSIVHLSLPLMRTHRTDQHVAAALELVASGLPPLWWTVPIGVSHARRLLQRYRAAKAGSPKSKR